MNIPDPKDDVGDSLEIFIDEGPDGEPIVDTLLRDNLGTRDAIRRAGDAVTKRTTIDKDAPPQEG